MEEELKSPRLVGVRNEGGEYETFSKEEVRNVLRKTMELDEVAAEFLREGGRPWWRLRSIFNTCMIVARVLED